MLTDKIGEESVNSFGSKMICFKYRNNVDIDVYFPEYKWVYKHATYNNFKKGSIRCPYEPRVCGKGYIGEGPYKKFVDGEITKCYRTWSGMINRCYNNNQSHDNPSYVGCSVCDEWLNYQNFSNWFDLNYYECGNELMSLDKDILCKNNKIYGPDTCIFVPIRINTLFTKRYNDRGETPIGTTIYGHNNKIRVYCNNKEGKRVNIGVYYSTIDAFEAYKEFKESVIKEIADEYKGIIPNKLYEAMHNYEVNIYD